VTLKVKIVMARVRTAACAHSQLMPISQVRPNESVTLVRNPYFRQWSYAAQPAGYPSVIRYERMADPNRQEPAVNAGRADLGESGTTNAPVTVWSFNDAPGKAAGSYLVGLLHDLGYRASLHAVPDDRFWTDLYDCRLKIQVSIGAGWGADFPSPSTFFGPLLSCQSADEPATSNWARFCDPHVDALVSQARAAQLTDPPPPGRLWAQADRIATGQAPYVPILNAGMTGFVASRAGNYQASPVYGPLLDQMWVR
jgi:peptide/nickel transport system substrate-binding protein